MSRSERGGERRNPLTKSHIPEFGIPPMTTLDLSGTWQLASTDQSHALTAAIPGDVHSALQKAGVIADPYAGRNEDDVQWVAHKDWVLERDFTLDGGDLAGSWYLDIESLDTVAEVYVNDALVLQSDNCFRRYRPDVSSALRAGENRLRVILRSSIAAGAERQGEQPFYIPYSTRNSPIPPPKTFFLMRSLRPDLDFSGT